MSGPRPAEVASIGAGVLERPRRPPIGLLLILGFAYAVLCGVIYGVGTLLYFLSLGKAGYIHVVLDVITWGLTNSIQSVANFLARSGSDGIGDTNYPFWSAFAIGAGLAAVLAIGQFWVSVLAIRGIQLASFALRRRPTGGKAA